MARTAIGVVMTLVIVALAAAASYVVYQRTVEPGTVVNLPVREQPARPAPPPTSPSPRGEGRGEGNATQPPVQPTPAAQPVPTRPTQPATVVQPAKLPLVYVADGVLGDKAAFNQNLGGIAIDSDRDLLYAVADSTNVLVFSLKTGRQAGRFQVRRETLSVGVDSAGGVYVGQVGRAEKYVRQPDGQYRRELKIGDGQLGRVTAIRVSSQVIACADAAARKIVFYNAQGQPAGRQIPAAQVALVGTPQAPQRILLPNDTLDFDFNISGRVVMAHPGRHEVQTYEASGKRVVAWGRFDEHQPDGFSGCCNPINVANFPLLRLGRTDLTARGQGIVTAEKGPARVKVYDETGKLLSLIGPEHFNQNNRRMYLAVDKQARIYVADTDAKTIRRFKPEK